MLLWVGVVKIGETEVKMYQFVPPPLEMSRADYVQTNYQTQKLMDRYEENYKRFDRKASYPKLCYLTECVTKGNLIRTFHIKSLMSELEEEDHALMVRSFTMMFLMDVMEDYYNNRWYFLKKNAPYAISQSFKELKEHWCQLEAECKKKNQPLYYSCNNIWWS